jgi:WD40 repeat protein
MIVNIIIINNCLFFYYYFRTTNNEKMRQFFSNDFTKDRWRKAALKNAFALLSKQRFEHAAAFFLLSGKLWDAIDVCISRLNDIQLAIVIARLYEGDSGPCYKKLLNTHILGVSSDPSIPATLSNDPYLRSMAYWLLGDYTSSLETLIIDMNTCDLFQEFNPRVFNFYYFIRSHPLVLLHKNPSKAPYSSSIATRQTEHQSAEQDSHLTLTPSERNFIFVTAYYHLITGSPILSLTVLSKLPKNEPIVLPSTSSPLSSLEESLKKDTSITSKTTQLEVPSVANDDDDFDWSMPVSSQIDFTDTDEFPYTYHMSSEYSYDADISEVPTITDEKDISQPHSSSNMEKSVLVRSLIEQLQYNSLLSIFTEELALIHLQESVDYMWKNKIAIPPRKSKDQCMVDQLVCQPLGHVLAQIQKKLVNWLKNESLIVKQVCGIDIDSGSSVVVSSDQAAHAGYDLLATLLNYVSLHANSCPHMLAVQMELLHLMNTLLPWSTGLARSVADTDGDLGPAVICAVNPAQLPLLTSCSLPSKHPLNMALNIRLMSASIFYNLSSHIVPPTSANPLENIQEVFDLCCALSHCVYMSLNPMRFQDKTSDASNVSSPPTRKRLNSGGNLLEIFNSLDVPNSKPSKWPGLEDWPNCLLSDDGKENSSLCLVLMEAYVVTFCGLLSVAWSKHSVLDLIILLANMPSQKNWNSLFGGGYTVKLSDQKKTFVQRIVSMKKLLRQSNLQGNSDDSFGLYVAPKRSLLHAFFSKPSEIQDLEDDEDDEDEGSNEDTMDNNNLFNDPVNPDSYCWCLMNLGIIQLIHKTIRSTVSLTGMEILEFITASPVLYKLLSLLQEWEMVFTAQIDRHAASDGHFFPGEDAQSHAFGPALMRHKFILEPDHSPFRNDDKTSQMSKRLWNYLVHQEIVRETFIRYIFYKKRIGSSLSGGEPPVQRILYHQPDTPVSCLCINSSNAGVFALATSKEVLEVEVPDIMSLDVMMDVDETTPTNKRGSILSVDKTDDYIMIPSGTSSQSHRNFLSPGHVTYLQSGCTSSILLKRSVVSVKRMAAHPTLAYYLTGGADGSIKMFEFGTPKPVSILRQAGAGLGVTQIKFTPQGNKYGVTDSSGKLSLWQGIQGFNKEPYQIFNPVSTQQTIADFAFLGSSSLIATCGESTNNKNVCIWDTLMPPQSNIVNDWVCHESGASCIVFSSSKQRLISGGRKGEIYIYDVRSQSVVSKPVVHSAAISCIVINDSEGYFITGSTDGEIKIWDTSTISELMSIKGRHARSRLFRPDEGVMDMTIDSKGCLYSCGADGTVKVHSLELL